MKQILVATLLVLGVACSQKENTAARPASPAAPATAETFRMKGTLISRDAGKNTINIDNEAVPGKMAAMKMDYEVRGAKVASLPADGSKIEVTVHEQNGTYWLTDVKPAP